MDITPRIGWKPLLACRGLDLKWNDGSFHFTESKLDKACFLIHGHIVQCTLYFCRIECIRLARNFFDSIVIHFFYHRRILGDDVHVLKGGLAVNREPGKSRGRKRDGRTHRKNARQSGFMTDAFDSPGSEVAHAICPFVKNSATSYPNWIL